MKKNKFLRTLFPFFVGSLTTFTLLIVLLSLGVWGLLQNDNYNKLLDYLGIDIFTDSVQFSRTILEEESSVIEVVDNSSSAVVSISIKQVELSAILGPQSTDSNIGTGFLISEDGLIATNQHVVSDENADYSVTTRDQKTYEVTNIYRDEVNDIALIQIDVGDETLPYIELGDSDELKVGQTVIAIGTPLGEYPGTVTTGIVSGVERTVQVSSSSFWSSSKEYEGVVQTDAAINPGNSGGPLLNSIGQAVGINFATTSGADNISFAIPINILADRLEDFWARGGKFVKPYLGVSYQMIGEYDALRFQVPVGAFIEDLEEEGPADQSGIEKGDIIVEISGKEVSGGLQNVIAKFNPGEEVVVKLWRQTGDSYSEGEYLEKTVTLGELES